MTVKWNNTADEERLLTKILERGKFTSDERRKIAMDLEACHSNGCPLRYDLLLSANDVDFFHDIRGIGKAIDRTTGKLSKLFSPRCAASNHTKRKAA